MRRARPTPPLLLLAGFAACTCQRAPAPVLGAVEPAQARTDVFTVLAVRGEGFQPRVTVDFDSPGDSPVDSTFGLWLVAGTIRVPLTDVSLASESELSASYPALAAAPGTYDLELLDPHGNRAVLPQAFTVLASKCGGLKDGTPCDDGNACTLSASCLSGVCTRTALVSCAPPPECRSPGACDPAAQSCQYPAVPDGTPCAGLGICVAGATCQAGACACVNTAPFACLTVTPTSGVTAATSFTFDASCSSDREDPTAALQIQFDFEGSGTWVPADGAAQAAHAYAAAGVYAAIARVTDTGGLTAYAVRRVAVADPASQVLVTTLQDEDDPNPTPANWGNTGLSLREAVNYLNGLVLAGQPAAKTVSFSAGLSGTLLLGTPLDPLEASGASIVGRPDILLDFQGAKQACLTLDAAGQTVLGLRVTGCDATAIFLSPSSSGSRVAECTLAGPSLKTSSAGIEAQSASIVGPMNDVSGYDTGVRFPSLGGYTLDGNRLHDNVTGAVLTGVTTAGALVARNLFYANTGDGLHVTSSPGLTLVHHNVFDGNLGNGLSASSANPPPLDARNDLFTHNGAYGTSGPISGFSPFDHNGFFGNALGPIAGAAPGATDVTADPRYVDRAAGDFRLLPGSPAVNAGVDVGLDVNGPESGNYNGAAPDLGAAETPY